MMNRLILLIIFIFPNVLSAQLETDSFIDDRDGNIYKTVKINNTIWFQDNLKKETATSFFPNQTKRKSKLKNGNYYTNIALDEVCPTGWEVPTQEDWNEYFNYRLTSKKGNLLSIQVDTLHEEYISLVYVDTSKTVKLFGRSNPLALKHLGWVEGRKKRKWGTTTYWIKHTAIEDERFHVHVRNDFYVMHRHKHHIDDVKEKRRKFLVKCIKRIK